MSTCASSDYNTAAWYYVNIEEADAVMSEYWPDIFVTMLGVPPACCNRFQRLVYAFPSHYRRDAWAYACTKRAIVERYVQAGYRTGHDVLAGNWSCTDGRWHEDALNVKARTRWTARTRRPSLFGLHARLMHFAKGTVAFIEIFPVRLE